MKIGFISDLHIDRNVEKKPLDYLHTLKQIIQEIALDQLIIGGDISNSFEKTLKFVEELQNQSEIPIYFIPGNHDFWEEADATKDTKGIYQVYKDHPQSLIEAPVVLNNQYTLVGHTAWYNHAIYDKNRFQAHEIENGKFRWAYWQDKLRLDWQMSDLETSKYFSKIIEQDLKKVQTENIILLTHMVTTPEFTMPMPHRTFDFFNAFIATDDLKEIVKKYPISHQLMGHVHFRAEIVKEKREIITNSLGYRREWRTKDMYSEMKKSLYVLDLNSKE